jgi:hypothetical protein
VVAPPDAGSGGALARAGAGGGGGAPEALDIVCAHLDAAAGALERGGATPPVPAPHRARRCFAAR